MKIKSLKMRNSALLAMMAGAAIWGAALGSTARAATIKGRVDTAPARAFHASTPINISKGAAAWVYYGYNGNAKDMYTDATNAAHFSAVNCPNLSVWTTGTAPAYVTFDGYDASPSQNFVFVNGPFTNGSGGGQSGNKFSFTSHLLAASETLRVYLISFNSRSNMSATLTSGGHVVATFHKDAILPTKDGDGTGAGHGYGILTLNISGGHVGEVLTVTDATDIHHVSATNNANVGIQAASVHLHGKPTGK